MQANDITYRRKQRELGEVQVALKLAIDLHKANPHIEYLRTAVRALLACKQLMFVEVKRMEEARGIGV